MSKKTDNHNLPAKLELRRYFLRKYHQQNPPSVFDCCQGSGVIWSKLRKEFTLSSYWGVDIKPKPGRLKIDSMRIVAQSGLPHDVIDIDTYGSPWKHWQLLLPNIHRPTTVFLTIGQHRMSGGNMDKATRKKLGLADLNVPITILARLHHLGVMYWLGTSSDHGVRIIEAVEAESSGNARYIGTHLMPIVCAI